MNAIQFIQQHGVEKAREVVDGAPEGATSIIGEMYFRFTDKEYWYWSFSGCKSKGKLEQYFYYKKRTADLSELKRIVESVDLIGKYHSVDHAKNHYNNMREALNQYQYENKDIEDLSNKLKQAIADYESIYGGEHV